MLDNFLAKNASANKVNSYYTLAISYCTFCVGKNTILGPVRIVVFELEARTGQTDRHTYIQTCNAAYSDGHVIIYFSVILQRFCALCAQSA